MTRLEITVHVRLSWWRKWLVFALIVASVYLRRAGEWVLGGAIVVEEE
jgi:hypothetical protein